MNSYLLQPQWTDMKLTNNSALTMHPAQNTKVRQWEPQCNIWKAKTHSYELPGQASVRMSRRGNYHFHPDIVCMILCDVIYTVAWCSVVSCVVVSCVVVWYIQYRDAWLCYVMYDAVIGEVIIVCGDRYSL